jgi:hypothetical protein
MIVALLILIVLILIFGAAAVKSAIARLVIFTLIVCVLGIGLGAIKGAIGEDGLIYALLGVAFGIPALLGVGLAISNMLEAREARRAGLASEKEANRRKPKIERLWHHFSKDIERFGPEARETARRYYDARNVHGLREFCRAEIARLNGLGDSSAR